jgi:hypothetical protein
MASTSSGYKQIQIAAGAVSDGAVGIPGIFTTKLENIALDDQKQPIVRQAIEFLNSWAAVTDGDFKRADISYMRQWIFVAHVLDKTCTITIINVQTLQVTQIPIVSATNIYSVFFTEIEGITFSSAINAVVGATAIMISGLDKMYFIDDTLTAKQLKIKTAAAATGEIIKTPSDCTLFQSRLAILCYLPFLVAGSATAYSSKHRVLFSRTDQVDIFTVSGEGATATQIKKNPIDAVIISDADEEFYALSTSEDLLIITTSKGLRIIKSGDDAEKTLTSTNIINYVGGWGNTQRCRAMQFAGFLIFATTFTLRAKMLQSLETDYINTIDLVLPILSNFKSEIRDVTMDYNSQNLFVFCMDGTCWTVAPQCMIPSKSYNLSLPVACSYKTDGLSFLFASSLNPAYTLVSNRNANGKLFYSLLKRDYDLNRYGYLSDGATEFAWDLVATNVSGNSFVATWPVSEWGAMLDTTKIIGMWLCFDAPNSRWVFFATDVDNYPKFTTNVDIASSQCECLTEGSEYICMLVVSDDGYKTLIGPFAQENAVMEMNFDWMGESDGVSYAYTYFHNAPIGAFGMVQDMPTNQVYAGSIVSYIAIGAPKMAIGWRDTNCVDNLSNRGGIRCVLLSDTYDISEYIEFYTDNYSVSVQVGFDSTEIEFHTNMDASYTEKSIKARISQFLGSDGDRKFTYLIGQY